MYESKDTYNGLGDIWSSILSPIKNVAGQLEQHVIRPILSPISKVGVSIEKKIIRPTIGSGGIGRPLATAAKQIEQNIIRPYLAPLLTPIKKVLPKITIAGHTYDLGGSELLQKAATGAVAGFASSGSVYGAIAGAVGGILQKGKPDVMKNLISGAVAGYLTTVKIFPSSQIQGTGMTAGDMAAAGASPQQIAEISAAANAPGGFAANAALMPSVGTIPGTGMTMGEMIAAGASTADINAALANAYQPISGTNMTAAQMIDAGATPQQVSEITQAANAPGGLSNPDNAVFMPSVGDAPFLSGVSNSPAGQMAKQSFVETVKDVGTVTSVAGAGVGLAQKTGLIKTPSQERASIQDNLQMEKEITTPTDLQKSMPMIIGAVSLVTIGSMLYYKFGRK